MVVRNHWCVENELHWLLDVCFGEDQSRSRIRNAPENLSRVCRIALIWLCRIEAGQNSEGWDQGQTPHVRLVREVFIPSSQNLDAFALCKHDLLSPY
jgi:hypothetical protein